MILLRQKSYSWDEIKRATKTIGGSTAIGAAIGFGPFKRHSKIGAAIGGTIGAGLGTAAYISEYKYRKQIEKEAPHRQEIDNIIRKNFSWILEYSKDLRKKINGENKKLKELSKKLSLDKFISDQVFFDNPFDFVGNSDMFDYIICLYDSEDTCLNPKKSRYIGYNETTNEIELYEGYFNHSHSKVCSIKNKSQLQNVLKKYYFDEILSNLNYMMNHYGAYSLDFGEYSLMANSADLSEEQYYKALDTYCGEIKKFIKTL